LLNKKDTELKRLGKFSAGPYCKKPSKGMAEKLMSRLEGISH
jgi:hypothetical protein